MNELIAERKFTAHSLDAQRAVALIGFFCQPDPVYHKGTVNSIYFDTPVLSTFEEKINGDTQKRKYRLRWYDGAGAAEGEKTPAFVEIKYRYGSSRDKLRKRIRVNRAWIDTVRLNDAALPQFLYRQAASMEDNLPLCLVPVLCISYDRLRYVCRQTGMTVCIDMNIRSSRINTEVFSAAVPFGLNAVVCEIKGHGYPAVPWAEHLYKAGFRIRSFSKYGECINQVMQGCAPTVIRMSI